MPHVQIGLFREHKGDPLSFLILEETRTAYTHACIITDRLRNEISEAYAPHVRRRILDDSEVEGVDVFDINGLTAEQSQAILDECAKNTPFDRLAAMEAKIADLQKQIHALDKSPPGRRHKREE